MQMLNYIYVRIYVMPRDDIVPAALGSASDLKSIQMGPRGEKILRKQNMLMLKYIHVMPMPRDDIVPTALGSVFDLKSIQMGPRGENIF